MFQKILFLIVYFSTAFSVYALVPDNIFQDDNTIFEKLALDKELNSWDFKKFTLVDHFSKFATDPNDQVDNLFAITPFFEDSVRFWFNIYSVFDSHVVAVHDKSNLRIIYDITNYSELRSSNLNRFTKAAIQNQLNIERYRKIKYTLLELSGKKEPAPYAKSILRTLKDANVSIPANKNERVNFFKQLASGIRSQTGQRDNIVRGIKNARPYLPMIKRIFEVFKAPMELLAIPFLESSFTYKAKSKAGATGAWQFIWRTGRYFLTVNKYVDERLNPLISTIGAMHLLRESKTILKRWDLAITAYNSGIKHLLRARKKLGRKNLSLETILQSYEHPHLGFASKNYYSEFLALAYGLAYKEKIFNENVMKLAPVSNQLKLNKSVPTIYLTKCSIKPSWLYGKLKKTSPHIKQLNTHLKYKNRSYPKGTAIISDVSLTKSRYRVIREKEYLTIPPKKWKKLVKNQSCSTK